MNDKTMKTERERRAGAKAPNYSEMLMANVPQSVRDQIEEYRRSRETERTALVKQVEDYDKATRQYEGDLLQVWEMSLQSRSRKPRQRGPDREREVER